MVTFDPVKTARVLREALAFIELKRNKKVNLTVLCRNIGISRARFYNLLDTGGNSKHHEPSFSVIAKLIEYFKLEGYALSYLHFISEQGQDAQASAVPQKSRLIPLYDSQSHQEAKLLYKPCGIKEPAADYAAYVVDDSLPGLIEAGGIVIVDTNQANWHHCRVLCRNSTGYLIATKDQQNYFNLLSATRIDASQITPLGKIIDLQN